MSLEETLLKELAPTILDPLARDLAADVQWWNLKALRSESQSLDSHNEEFYSYPIAITGNGPPILLLHGFDSSFLEFRRLAPLLKNQHQLIIPDLHGFGFGPRPKQVEYGSDALLYHLGEVLERLPVQLPVSLIGASMGGAVALELAKKYPNRIDKVLLLSPAGLTGRKMPLITPFNKLGVWILSSPFVRRGLCRQAFAHPDNSVGEEELQIASLHLNSPGWGRSLAAFALSGGMACSNLPLPKHDINVIWGSNDRILSESLRREASDLIGRDIEKIKDCGHLPHLDCPEIVLNRWLKIIKS